MGHQVASIPGWLCDLGQPALPLWVQQRRCSLTVPPDLIGCGFISLTIYMLSEGEDNGRRK